MQQGFNVEFYANIKYIKKVSSKLVVFQLSAFHFGWVNLKGRAFKENVDKIDSLQEDTWIKGTGSITINEWTNNKTGEENKDVEITIEQFTIADKPEYNDKSSKGKSTKQDYQSKQNYQGKNDLKTKADNFNFDDDDLPF